MTTTTEKTPAGWKDGLFYPDGFNGKAFGVQLIEIAKGEYKVVYPVVNKPEPKVEVAVVPETPRISVQQLAEPITKVKKVVQHTPANNVTDNLPIKCLICNNPVPGKRADRLFCSAKCRKKASRNGKQLELIKNK